MDNWECDCGDCEGEAMFTPKSEGITDLMEAITGKPRTEGECVFDSDGDGQHSMVFVDELSKREYEISGMCQTCQDGVFG